MINRFCVTRIFVALTTAIGTSALLAIPGWAFTLSSSEATFTINNFSDLPLDVQTFQDAYTEAIAADGTVQSNADANARFLTDQANQANSQANGSSASIVSGNGNDYVGLAQSIAEVIGYRFAIASGETFSFDFTTSLNLKTSIDDPGVENATAVGSLFLGLYDASDPANLTLLDFLTISSNLGTSGNRNDLAVNQSAGITFSSNQTALDTVLAGKPASASASVQGSLSRSFTSPTSLTLVKSSVNQATAAAVPEPSSVLASLLGIGLVGIRFWRKPKMVK